LAANIGRSKSVRRPNRLAADFGDHPTDPPFGKRSKGSEAQADGPAQGKTVKNVR